MEKKQDDVDHRTESSVVLIIRATQALPHWANCQEIVTNKRWYYCETQLIYNRIFLLLNGGARLVFGSLTHCAEPFMYFMGIEENRSKFINRKLEKI